MSIVELLIWELALLLRIDDIIFNLLFVPWMNGMINGSNSKPHCIAKPSDSVQHKQRIFSTKTGVLQSIILSIERRHLYEDFISCYCKKVYRQEQNDDFRVKKVQKCLKTHYVAT